ncbi:unnamed protein product [Fraxinus pennsylvanica]|uniref:Uncharacterized protein n=1 Tax=Fraxinus pennsylvanica TaxID=56036 RepID=A0AAD2DY54_9LAMI|nr:unnamed protein product [Fraxinus pennsylvanica]
MPTACSSSLSVAASSLALRLIFEAGGPVFFSEIAEVVGSHLGIFLEVDTNLSGSCWGSHMRIRAKLNVSKPLVATMDLQLGSMGGTVEVEFKYKRLPEYCTWCGHLDLDLSTAIWMSLQY